MKKTLAMLLALLLCLSLLPFSAMAEEGDVEVTVAGDTEVEGQITLRQALEAVSDGCTVIVPESVENIALSAPLTVSKNVSIRLSGQTVSAAFDANAETPILATILVAENARLTLLGRGTVAAASDTDTETVADTYGVFVKEDGALTVKDEIALSAPETDVSSVLISLSSRSSLSVETSGNITGGACAIAALGAASDYTLNINMDQGVVSSRIALFLTDTPTVQIQNARLTGTFRAIDRADDTANPLTRTLSEMTVSGYWAYVPSGTDLVPVSPDEFAASPAADVLTYVFQAAPPAPTTYNVTLNSGTGYTVAPANESSSPVNPGDSFSFTVTIQEGFTAGDDFSVKANDTALTASEGVYTIENIQADQNVTVTGVNAVTPTTYTVTLTPGTGYTLTAAEGSSSPVNAGSSFSFTLAIQEGYTQGSDFSVKANDTVLTASEGVYTIENIQAAQTVTVTGVIVVTPTTYTVTLTPGTGYTLTAAEGSSSPVNAGGSFSFTLTIQEGYTQGSDFSVKANDTVLTANEGVYTIENIQAAQNITVTGVIVDTPATYTVTLTPGTGYTLTAAEGSSSPVNAGGSFSFTVAIQDGYTQGSGFSVKANNTALTASEGVYTIDNIQANQTVTVTGVNVVTHTVTYVDGQGKTLHTDTVNHGQAAPAYTTTPTRDGYTFKGWDKTLPAAITADVTLTAQWEAVTHTVTYVDGQGNTLHTDTVTHGQAAPAYTTQPTRDGYTFKGWDKTLPAAITADITLTAQWEAVPAPTVTSRYPTRFTENAADFYFTASQTGYYYYLIFNPGAAVPSVDDLINKGVSGSCQAAKETTVSLKNLSNSDAKEIYIMLKNEAGVRSSIYRITVPAYFTPPSVVTYTVTLNSGTGYTVRAANNSSSPVNAGGSFSFTVDVQNGYMRGTGFSVKANGVELTGNNGVYTVSNIQANQAVNITGVVAQQTNNGGGGGYAPRPTVATPSVTTTTLPSAVMGQEYKQQLTAAGGAPITWSYTGTLPEGISLSSTGLLSGTPKAEGTFRFAVKVSNSAGSMTRQLSLVVAGNDYAVTQGNNSDWSQGTSDGITFQGSGQSAFTVRIDGSSVPASKLTLSEDGKSVTVSPEYLETLSTGSHTLTLVYPDGSARTKFNIHSTAKAVSPSISAQPMSSEAREGENVTFAVTASGTNPAFQWQVDTGDGKGWEDIPGATGASYTVDGVTPDQTGWQYRCVITNAAGEAESNGATLTVKEALGEVTAETDQPVLKKSNIGKILLFSGLGLAAVGLAVGLVIYFRRRNDFYDD